MSVFVLMETQAKSLKDEIWPRILIKDQCVALFAEGGKVVRVATLVTHPDSAGVSDMTHNAYIASWCLSANTIGNTNTCRRDKGKWRTWNEDQFQPKLQNIWFVSTMTLIFWPLLWTLKPTHAASGAFQDQVLGFTIYKKQVIEI